MLYCQRQFCVTEHVAAIWGWDEAVLGYDGIEISLELLNELILRNHSLLSKAWSLRVQPVAENWD